MHPETRRRLLAFAAFALPFVVFLAGPYCGSGDTDPAELLPISLLERGRFDFDSFYASRADLPYAYRRIHGHVVSVYPIVAGILNVPTFAAARALGVDLVFHRRELSRVSADGMASASVLFLFLALRRICRSDARAFFFALVYAFATEVWAVAGRGLWQHTPAILFLAVGYWLILRDEPRPFAAAGVAFALAVLSRPTNLLFGAASLGFLAERRRRACMPFLLGAAFPAVPAAIYSAAVLRDPLAFGQLYRNVSFGGSIPSGLLGILASPSRGLFLFSPVLLAAVVGFAASIRSSEDPAAFLRWQGVAVVGLVLLTSAWGMWWGGASFGYRLLIDAVPALVMLTAFAAEKLEGPRPSARIAFSALLTISVGVEILGVLTFPTRFNERIDLEPARLWSVRESELVLAVRALLGRADEPAPPRIPTVWWTPGSNDDGIPGWLDSSVGGRTIRGPLEISGWAQSSGGEVDVALVLDDGSVIRPARLPRPDVSRALPELGRADRAGFRTELPAPAGPPRMRALAVEFRGPGGSVRRLGPIRFRWGS